jgi:hypothetical protein
MAQLRIHSRKSGVSPASDSTGYSGARQHVFDGGIQRHHGSFIRAAWSVRHNRSIVPQNAEWVKVSALGIRLGLSSIGFECLSLQKAKANRERPAMLQSRQKSWRKMQSRVRLVCASRMHRAEIFRELNIPTFVGRSLAAGKAILIPSESRLKSKSKIHRKKRQRFVLLIFSSRRHSITKRRER